MITINLDNRADSFELIQKEIAEQTFENINFTHSEKTVYQSFANDLCSALCKIKDSLIVERDSAVIIENLRMVLRDNALEKYIFQEESLISCFINSNYTYYKKDILVQNVRQFYDFLLYRVIYMVLASCKCGSQGENL